MDVFDSLRNGLKKWNSGQVFKIFYTISTYGNKIFGVINLEKHI